jgi:hypothetical protein
MRHGRNNIRFHWKKVCDTISWLFSYAIHRNNLVVSQGRIAKSYCTTQRSTPVYLLNHAHARGFVSRCLWYRAPVRYERVQYVFACLYAIGMSFESCLNHVHVKLFVDLTKVYDWRTKYCTTRALNLVNQESNSQAAWSWVLLEKIVFS